MLPALLRTGALIVFWRRYLRRRFKGLILSVAAISLVLLIHSEALAYLQATGKSDLVPWAFYFRWAAWLIIPAMYYFRVERSIARAPVALEPQKEPTYVPPPPPPKEDGFDAVRGNGAPLRSRAQQIIEDKKHGKQNKDR